MEIVKLNDGDRQIVAKIVKLNDDLVVEGEAKTAENDSDKQTV
jgi:hypothetical protein